MLAADLHDHLNAEELRAGLRDPYIGNRIIVVEETTSTNDLIWQMAQDEIAEGLVVFAEVQTGGRGQRGNRWESASHQGLWFSVLLRPAIGPAESARLTMWAAQAVATTVQEELQIDTTIKQPNDVCVAGRKIAGVLIDMRVWRDGSYLTIAGIGVNVNQGSEDFPEELRDHAGSLAMVADKRVDRHAFAIALLRNLDRAYHDSFAS